MSESDERRREHRRREQEKSSTQTRPQSQTSEPIRPTFGKLLAENALVLLVGLLAAGLGIFFACRDAAHEPEILAPLFQDPNEPFALPFIVRNISWLFSMDETHLKCRVEKLVFTDSREFKNGTFDDIIRLSIPSEHSANLRCLIMGPQKRNMFKLDPPGELLEGKMYLSVEYRMFWINRESEEMEFNWYTAAKPARWIEGPIVD
jgi:hypothetical protein